MDFGASFLRLAGMSETKRKRLVVNVHFKVVDASYVLVQNPFTNAVHVETVHGGENREEKGSLLSLEANGQNGF